MGTTWRAFTETNLSRFCFLEVLIGIWMPIPGLEWHWVFDHRTAAVMGLMRWHLIMRFWHFNSNNINLPTPQSDETELSRQEI